MRKKNYLKLIFLILIGMAVTGCTLRQQEPELATEVPTITVPPTVVDTPLPSLTPTEQIDYAALVNGEGIRQTSFEASLLQLDQAMQDYPELLADQVEAPEELVLEELVNRALLSQAARDAGFRADDQIISEQLEELTNQVGGEEALILWLSENGYTLETFLFELPLELEAAWQRDQIAAGVPDRLEQVRARQVLFYDPFQASRAYDQLQAGISFDSIVENNDPNDLGYLDWFPRGVLLIPALEQTAFSLSPGQYSEIIETEIGYHILYVIEKDPDRPLSAEVRMILEEQAVENWLAQQRAQASVEILLP